MRTITFYSYKGGVGRTLAATNFAIYLAKLGQKTVLIDFDLEAPGIDSKFQDFNIQTGQKGILDYIIEYQQTKNAPGSIEKICLQVPVKFSGNTTPLYLVPAGDYLSTEYYKKLSQLDWDKIFSEEYEGVAFFQNFLASIKNELQPDFVIVDSRTGIGEIAGLCTQQLADEVVMISSLSGESIKMTKHIKQLIMQSEIAKALEKSVDVKVVVSRVPKPDDLDSFKKQCCERFDIDETKLFFLFSSPILEQEEFLAVNTFHKDDELLDNYVRLFHGLKIDLASESIRNEIEQITNKLLKIPPEESEKRILELSALYPHSDVYRTAMNFFYIRGKIKETKDFGWKTLNLLPDDEDSLNILAKIYTEERYRNESEFDNAIKVFESLWKKEKLGFKESLYYAELLERIKKYSESFEVALYIYNNANLNSDIQMRFRLLAARCAFRLDKRNLAYDLIEGISMNQLDNSLALLVIGDMQNKGDFEDAFEMVKQIIERRNDREIDIEILEEGIKLAHQIQRSRELEKILASDRELLQRIVRRSSPSKIRELYDMLGIYNMPILANEIDGYIR